MKDALGSVQSVLVLGANSDIAQATVRKLVGRRARTVVLAVREPASVEAFADELRGLGATAVSTIAFDAHDTDHHAAFVDDAFALAGDVDLAILTFGVLGDQEEAERDAAAAIEIAQVNYLGSVSTAVPISQRMQQQGHGTIVALSSVAGERARRSNFVYGSSKAGMDAFFQGLGDALVGTGVHVMIVRPGFVHTKMTAGMDPAPLSTTAEAVADAIVRGLERGTEAVWVPSTLRYVMSLLRHVPRPIFRKLPI
ncbi:MAG TPA: decaprenylphospho-beta-D-erythro-pentofuranosid-2-ulose 2-reductase [Acidimicrobiia bacterium]|nr:decaprenylphospho-beta-D-erythro-pentofuranosid-2-ulose 2-reductase [Acidimicrobiia bacterium]